MNFKYLGIIPVSVFSYDGYICILLTVVKMSYKNSKKTFASDHYDLCSLAKILYICLHYTYTFHAIKKNYQIV